MICAAEPSVPPARWIRWVLFLVVVAGGALRFVHLDAQSVWYDESISVAECARPLNEVVGLRIADGYHPPLHHILLHGWFGLVGPGAWQGRAFSAVLGTASLLLLYLLARRFTTPTISLVASALMAFSQMGIHYSREARPYEMVLFLSLLAALSFLSLLAKPDSLRTAAFATTGAALLYTHYYGAATLLALGAYALIFRREVGRSTWIRLAAAAFFWVAACAPWVMLVRSGRGLSEGRFTLARDASQRPSIKTPIGVLNRFNNAKFTSLETPTAWPLGALGFVIFTIPAATALWSTRRTNSHGAVMAWLLFSLPVAMVLLAGTQGVLNNYRHYSFAKAGYSMAVAIGWGRCSSKFNVRLAWLAAMAIFTALSLPGTYAHIKPDYRAALVPLAENYRAGDCALTRPNAWKKFGVHLAWEVYYRERGPLRPIREDSRDRDAEGCSRLWVISDRTAWMNRKPLVDPAPAFSATFDVARRYSHPALDLLLLQRKR